MLLTESWVTLEPSTILLPAASLLVDKEERVKYSAEYQHLKQQQKKPKKQDKSIVGVRNADEAVKVLLSRKQQWMRLTDKGEHSRLHDALKKHLGAQYKAKKQASRK